MKAPLDTSWIYNKAGVQPQYGYCVWNSSTYMTYAEDCASCLQGQEGGVIIGNLADTNYNACKSKPQAVDGELVTSSRDLFDASVIDPSATTATTSSISTSTSTSSESSSDTSSPISSSTSSSASDAAMTGFATATSAITTSASDGAASVSASSVQSESSGLSSGAAAGIGIGAALLTLAIAAGIFFILRRKKRAPAAVRLMTPPAHAYELGNARHVNEMGGGEKGWHKTAVHETGGLPLQELDASGHR